MIYQQEMFDRPSTASIQSLPERIVIIYHSPASFTSEGRSFQSISSYLVMVSMQWIGYLNNNATYISQSDRCFVCLEFGDRRGGRRKQYRRQEAGRVSGARISFPKSRKPPWASRGLVINFQLLLSTARSCVASIFH